MDNLGVKKLKRKERETELQSGDKHHFRRLRSICNRDCSQFMSTYGIYKQTLQDNRKDMASSEAKPLYEQTYDARSVQKMVQDIVNRIKSLKNQSVKMNAKNRQMEIDLNKAHTVVADLTKLLDEATLLIQEYNILKR